MKMKKLALSLAVASAMGATAVQAVVESEYAVGVLVPNVIHDGQGNTTAVGIISRYKGTVYWTFFDENSNHVTDGQFDVTANDFYPFVWREKAGFSLESQRGYLVFGADVSENVGGKCNPGKPDGKIDGCDISLRPITGHAVQVIGPTDLAFVPAIPMVGADFNPGLTLTKLGPDDVQYLVAGANCVAKGSSRTGSIGTLTESLKGPYQDAIDMRYYFIDGTSGSTGTDIVIWSARNIQGSHVVNMFDDQQNRKSVNLELPHKELNVIDVKEIKGRPASFKDGFIRWTVPCGKDSAGKGAPANGVISFSMISAPDFGAVQTIVNPFGANITP